MSTTRPMPSRIWPRRRLAEWLATVLFALLAITALTLAVRRSGGAFSQLPGPGSLLAVGLLLALTGAAVEALSSPRRRLVLRYLTAGCLLLVALALIDRKTSLASGLLLFLPLAAEQAWAWRHEIRRRTRRAPLPVADMAQASSDDAVPADDVLQQLTLSRTGDGRQQLLGWLRMPVAAGQRVGNLHVAFCPPFTAAPQVEFEQYDGPTCRIKAAQILPYGVRLEVKLDASAPADATVLVRFAATDAD